MPSPVLLPGAEPFFFEGSDEVGILVQHGFTGCPQSMRPWGEHLAAQGWTVAGPLLPGHGTRWQDMNKTTWQDWYAEAERALLELVGRCRHVFVFGLSMGATLTLRLAEQHADKVSAIAVVNPSLATERRDAALLPYIKSVVPCFPGIASDIKKPGVREVAYSKIPLRAAWSLQQLWGLVRADLHLITMPVLLFRSAEDHVVEAVSSRLLLEGLTNAASVEERVLHESYHVATLDNDAPEIFEASAALVRQQIGAPVSGE